MRSIIQVMMVLLFSTTFLKAQTTGTSTTNVILSNPSASVFSTKPVTDSEIDLIVQCGIKAPSSRNQQPWKFTVVKDAELITGIIQNAVDGNVLIVVSGVEDQNTGMASELDCALATENMFIAAQSLGLGARIYTGPIRNVNESFKENLGIPEGYRAVTILRIGNLDQGVDAISSASTRKEIGEVVIYK